MRALILGVLALALVHWATAQNCRNSARVRLVGGKRPGEGRLEVLGASGQWSSVCPDRWASRSAAVACKELCGIGTYTSSVPAEFIYGSGAPIRIFGTQCRGYEDSLLQCPHTERSRSGQCFEDAGVGLCCHSGCNGRNMFLAPRLRYVARCDYDSYTVTVENAPPSLEGIVYPYDLTPDNDPSCFDTNTGHNLTHKWMTVPFTKCGVQRIDTDSDYVLYKQTVRITGQTTGPAITRLFLFLLPVTCGLNRHTNKTEWIGSGSGSDNLTLPPVNRTLKVDLTIKVYKDPNFREEYGLPAKVPVGKPLYVKLAVNRTKLQGGDSRAKIVVEKCTAFPLLGAAPNLHHTVIDDQLAQDDGTFIEPSPALPEVRFIMQNFKIGMQYRELYLSCFVYICPSNDKRPRCDSKKANAQHLGGANKELDENAEFAGSAPTGRLGIVSRGYGVELPRFLPGSFTHGDFPNAGLGPDDYLRVGRDDGKYYHFKADGPVRLFRGKGNRP